MCTFVQVRIETLTPKTSPYALVVQLQASAAWDVGRGTVTDSDTARESPSYGHGYGYGFKLGLHRSPTLYLRYLR